MIQASETVWFQTINVVAGQREPGEAFESGECSLRDAVQLVVVQIEVLEAGEVHEERRGAQVRDGVVGQVQLLESAQSQNAIRDGLQAVALKENKWFSKAVSSFQRVMLTLQPGGATNTTFSRRKAAEFPDMSRTRRSVPFWFKHFTAGHKVQGTTRKIS